MTYFNEALKAKLQTLLGERGTGNDAAVRRKEINAILEKAAAIAASKAENAALVKTKEAIAAAKSASEAVETLRTSLSGTSSVIGTTDPIDPAQKDLLLEAMSQLFQWNGSSYTFRLPAIETYNIGEGAVTDTVRATDVLPGSLTSSTTFVDLFKILVNTESGYPVDFDIDTVFTPSGNAMFVLGLYRVELSGLTQLIEESIFTGIGGRIGVASFSATDFGDGSSRLTTYVLKGILPNADLAGGFYSPVVMNKITVVASKRKR